MPSWLAAFSPQKPLAAPAQDSSPPARSTPRARAPAQDSSPAARAPRERQGGREGGRERERQPSEENKMQPDSNTPEVFHQRGCQLGACSGAREGREPKSKKIVKGSDAGAAVDRHEVSNNDIDSTDFACVIARFQAAKAAAQGAGM